MHEMKRCGAWARQAGRPCLNWAMLNGRCRMHGGKCKGPPRGSQNNLKHGVYTEAAVQRRRELQALIRKTGQMGGGGS